MNDEGTLIPGSIIKEGYALAKPDYHAHKGCGQCKVNPLKCDWRQRHLHPGPRRITINAPPNGMFEFFVNSEGISESVLRAFLQRNNNDEIDEITCLRGRRFKVRAAVIPYILDVADANCLAREWLLRAFQLPPQQKRSRST